MAGADGSVVCRVLAAHQGNIHAAVPGIVRNLLFSHHPWKALHPGARTWGHAGLGFVCISVFLCAMQQLLFSFWATYPYRPLVVELVVQMLLYMYRMTVMKSYKSMDAWLQCHCVLHLINCPMTLAPVVPFHSMSVLSKMYIIYVSR